MLSCSTPPPRYRGLITDKGDTLWIERGRMHAVDGAEFPWKPGAVVAHGRRVLVVGSGQLRAEGEIRVTVAALDGRGARQPKVDALAAEVTTISGSPFVRLQLGARGHLHRRTRFEARSNAHAHLHDESSGQAYDEAVIFFEPGHHGQVLVLGHSVRLVAPRGQGLELRDTKRGIIARLAW